MKNIGIECYMSLLEMEAEHHKINEMIMAPKFAKLLNESVDETDFSIHKTKTDKAISEFVNKAMNNLTTHLTSITEQLETIVVPNNKLIVACEMKMKSLTREDRDNFVLEEYDNFYSIAEAKERVFRDIKKVNTELSKILETSFESREEYSNSMKSFKETISECSDRLNTIDISKMTRNNVAIEELCDTLNNYKETKAINECNEFALENITECNNMINSYKNKMMIKEAVYLGTEFLMRAATVAESLIESSYFNTQNILSEFVLYESSEDATAQFESAMSNLIDQESDEDDDYEDFI